MAEEAYAKDHPAHPANKHKAMPETHTDFGYDYAANHPARGGQGQPVFVACATSIPVDGMKHLYGLPGVTLSEAEKNFAALSALEQERRLEWNKAGIPAELLAEG